MRPAFVWTAFHAAHSARSLRSRIEARTSRRIATSVIALRRGTHLRLGRKVPMIGHRPLLRVMRIVRADDELARAEEFVNLREALHLARRHALEDVLR